MNDISYNEWLAMSDAAIMKPIGDFIQSNRLQKNRSQNKVAADTGICRKAKVRDNLKELIHTNLNTL